MFNNSKPYIIVEIICWLIFINICQVRLGLAQKPAFSLRSLKSWPSIMEVKVSCNGKFVWYTTKTKELGTSLFVRSTDSSFEKVYEKVPEYTRAFFSCGGNKLIFKKQDDTLCILDLVNKKENVIPNCISFQLPLKGKGEWLAYMNKNKIVILVNLLSNETTEFYNTSQYLFSDNSKVFVVQTSSTLANIKNEVLWVNLSKKKTIIIWRGDTPSNFAFNQTEDKLAFIESKDHGSHNLNYIFYFTEGMDSATNLINDSNSQIIKGYEIANSSPNFNERGDKIFFDLFKHSDISTTVKPKTLPIIWSYKDQFIQPERVELEKNNIKAAAVINVENRNILILDDGHYRVIPGYRSFGRENSEYLICEKKRKWEGYDSTHFFDLCLINTSNGEKTMVVDSLTNQIKISPKGKYIYWYNSFKRAYFTYNVVSKKIVNVSRNIPFTIYKESWDLPMAPPAYGDGPWLENDQGFLIYDKFDIWRVDPDGILAPQNLTNGFGRKNKTILRLVEKEPGTVDIISIENNDSIILCGFDKTNKYNGFYRTGFRTVKDPFKLVMSSAIYYFPESIPFAGFTSSYLMKADEANVYILQRQSSQEYPNFYLTSNFKDFTPLTNLEPQKQYNWLTSELMRWHTFDNQIAEGILYKPVNFNPNRKYPVIFYFYENLSDGLNAFIQPELSNGQLNIPYYVSNEYLIFCPDIHYRIGNPGESAFNYIVSAAKMLSKKPWVDANRMGIQGHSWGGYQVNYLVTRTSLFKAAVSAAGPTDFISGYFSLLGVTSHESFDLYEKGQSRIGKPLWMDKTQYISNSPIFNADKIKTPLLIMHNDNDRNVPWLQGLEMYLALRRLNRPVWMLQYEKQPHVVTGEQSKLDYTIRMKEFFDHYLKQCAAPKWMTKGISMDEDHFADNYELDSTGKCSSQCKICSKQTD
jgi:dienelactone hydrolase